MVDYSIVSTNFESYIWHTNCMPYIYISFIALNNKSLDTVKISFRIIFSMLRCTVISFPEMLSEDLI